MKPSYSKLLTEAREQDLPLVREFLAYASLCPASTEFTRTEKAAQFEITRTSSALHWSRQSEWPWVINEGNFHKGHTALDVGGGYSVLKYALAKRCGQVVCLDNDPLVFARVEQANKATGLGYNITQVKADACCLPFFDDQFDRVVCVSVLEHVEGGHIKAVRDMVRVLKPGGLMLLTMDVVLSGRPRNQYLGQQESWAILDELGVPEPTNTYAVSAEVPDDGANSTITVLFVYYAKP